MRLRPGWILPAVFLVLAATLPGRAQAHPHIWIDSLIQFDMRGGKIVSVTLKWRFDPMFSALIVRDFDKDKDGKFGKAEIADLRKRAFSALEKQSYFTEARGDNEMIKVEKVSKFSATIKDDLVVYTFTLKLASPVDPRKQKATFRFLDTSYYVAVQLQEENGVRLLGGGAKGCGYRIEKDRDNPIYSGLIIPDMVRITCTGA